MPRKRSTYTAEFRLAAIKMVLEQKLPFAEVEHWLGVGENLLHTQKKAVLKDGAPARRGDLTSTIKSQAPRIFDSQRPTSNQAPTWPF